MADEEETDVPADLIDRLKEIASIKEELDLLDAKRKKLQTEVVTTMIGLDIDTVPVDGVGKFTVVTPEKTVIDERRLAKKLGAAKWKEVTKVSLDREKLEAAVQLGRVDLTTVAECTELVPTAAYIKLSRRGR